MEWDKLDGIKLNTKYWKCREKTGRSVQIGSNGMRWKNNHTSNKMENKYSIVGDRPKMFCQVVYSNITKNIIAWINRGILWKLYFFIYGKNRK